MREMERLKLIAISDPDIPIYLNTYPFSLRHDWVQFQSTADMSELILYPSNELRKMNSNTRKFCDKNPLPFEYFKLAFIAEFSRCIWHGRHYEQGVLTPNHYRMICLSAFLAGQGWKLVHACQTAIIGICHRSMNGGGCAENFTMFSNSSWKAFKDLNPTSLTKLTEVAVTFIRCNTPPGH